MTVAHCDWREMFTVAPDALLVDAPYSSRTHAGHDDGTDEANKGTWTRPSDGVAVPIRKRRKMSYAAWSAHDVNEFVASWSPRTRGWFVSITDHVLASAWERALEAAGRYVFSPLPFVAPGSRVRMSGDGPSTWTCWIVVARPRSAEFARWGTLPGAYVIPPGHSERAPSGGNGCAVVGGKPVWLMSALVRDYTRPGDLVCDPCCGAGTTGVAARMHGRRFVGCDIDEKTADFARKRIERTREQIALPLCIERTREQETGT